ncbi:MAG: hypothetical protein KGL39_10410 [Patescibacteria group bacterium]|nr:hypothetical protein [Patescibacteria group bacterium]
MMTDAICIALLTRYGGSACVKSQFFTPIIACTGDASVNKPTAGVVEAKKGAVYAVADSDRISEYWVAGFAPKITEEGCPGGAPVCLSDRCVGALKLWSDAAKGGRLEDVHNALGTQFQTCMGCEGNAIVMPLIMFCDPDYGSASLLSEFPLSDWACLFGTPELQKLYCQPDLVSQGKQVTIPKLYRADRFTYATANDVARGNKPPGVNTMEEWMMATIYNFGPIVIGFTVYGSFGKFFRDHPKDIYTADYMLRDFQQNPDAKPQGGHAVVIVGWGDDPAGLPYWVVRNSWGTKWADDGYFRVERNIDRKLAAAGLSHRLGFEREFGIVYFAPDPNPALYGGADTACSTYEPDEPLTNPMTNFLLETPRATCESLTSIDLRLGGAVCSCPNGYTLRAGECTRDTKDNIDRRLRGVDGNFALNFGLGHKLLLLIVLLVLVAIVIGAQRRSQAKRAAVNPTGPAGQ